MSPSWFRVPPEIGGEDADDSDPGLEVEEILAIAAGVMSRFPISRLARHLSERRALESRAHEGYCPDELEVFDGLYAGRLKLSGGVCSQWSGNVLEIHLWLEHFGGVDS